MRISDWSADLCSSDLAAVYGGGVSFGERRWRVQLQPRDSGYDASLLWLMGATGTVASLLLALLLWSAATMRRRAVTLGRQLAERYRESEERFRTLNDLLPALVLMARADDGRIVRSEEQTSELQSLMRNSYAVFCLNKTTTQIT